MPPERPPRRTKERNETQEESSLDVVTRTRERLEHITRNPDKYIDEGGAARVYQLPAGACMKVMRPHNESLVKGLQLGNTPEVEAQFLERLASFTVAGVRSPQYFSMIRDQDFTALIMEKIEGVNLQKVLNGEAPIPKTFSHHAFFEALEKYFQELHERENVVHGDLEARNIMVDEATGLPCVIDFGRSRSTKDLPIERKTRVEHLEWERLTRLEGQLAALGGLTT